MILNQLKKIIKIIILINCFKHTIIKIGSFFYKLSISPFNHYSLFYFYFFEKLKINLESPKESSTRRIRSQSIKKNYCLFQLILRVIKLFNQVILEILNIHQFNPFVNILVKFRTNLKEFLIVRGLLNMNLNTFRTTCKFILFCELFKRKSNSVILFMLYMFLSLSTYK